jgi:diketogulonate reductase-like aldo/keto reductase
MAKLELSVPDLTLPDGNKIPMVSGIFFPFFRGSSCSGLTPFQLGYGTGTAWFKKTAGAKDQACIDATKTAIKVGYTHLDGAEVYNTEEELGVAIKESKVPREKLFVTTKLHDEDSNSVGDIPGALDRSLKKLGLEYVDLYLIHSPFFAKGEKKLLQEAWAQMEQMAAVGKAKSIGVSNFLKSDLNAILETCKVRPAINQIEYHPYLQHGDLVAFHKSKDIKVAAYAPLTPITRAKGGPLDGYLESLAKKYAVGPGEILLRWCIDQNVVAVTTSSKEQRLSDMLRTFTFKLTPKEVEEISNLGKEHHFRAFWNHVFDDNDKS